MVNFVVIGPFDVPIVRGAHGGRLLEHKIQCRNKVASDANNRKINGPGCYVFACSAPRSGAFPIYVGKATKNILNEAFNDRNINNLNHFLLNRKKGRLQLYAIYQQKVKLLQGNSKVIAEIEEFLIGYAALRNRNLLNIHGNSDASWTIAGVANNGSGNPGASALAFKSMMGVKPRSLRQGAHSADEIKPAEVESETPDTQQVKAIEAETQEPEAAA
jgi:hypothetical protein